MALEDLDSWKERLLAMPSVSTSIEGAQNLADFYGDKADKVQADSPDGSSEGIFTFNRSVFVVQLIAQGFGPSSSADWIPKISTAYEMALKASSISASTVTNSAWTATGNKDTQTKSTGIEVITTISAAKGILEAGLISAENPFLSGGIQNPDDMSDSNALFAKAFRDATLAFVFTCIGKVMGVPPVEVPLTFPAK